MIVHGDSRVRLVRALAVYEIHRSEMMMMIYMQLNTYVTAWAQAATWLTFLSVSPSLDSIGIGADVDAGVDVGADADVTATCSAYVVLVATELAKLASKLVAARRAPGP